MRHSAILSLALSSSGLVATPTRAAAAYVSQEQEQTVREAVAREKSAGLPAPLATPPDVASYDKVLLSDAVSVVEVAHADFAAKTFYLSVQNPWTNVTDWYGPFAL